MALQPQPGPEHIRTAGPVAVGELAMSCLDLGHPMHCRAPAGSGKTGLALDLAQCLSRPVPLPVGDDSFGTAASRPARSSVVA